MLKIGDTPLHLGHPIRVVAQGQDSVVITLGDGVAMAPVPHEAFPVRLKYFPIGRRMVFFHPRKEGRPEIETDGFIIVENAFDAPTLEVKHPGESVGAVAFVIDAVVPIGKRLGAGLVVNDAGPGVFPGGLVEMSMNDESGSHKTSVFTACSTGRF